MSQTTVATYEIVDHGLEHSQYFQGCGTAFTEYDHCTTGIGDTYADALDDALESLAQMGFDSEQLEQRILNDNQWKAIPSDGPSACEESAANRNVEIVQDDDTGKWLVYVDGQQLEELFDTEDEANDVEIDPPEESELYYHVSIRWSEPNEVQKTFQSMRAENNGQLPDHADGYPIYYLADDNGVICPDCANGKNDSDASEFADKGTGWRLVAHGVHWEGEPLTCEHCEESIKSAYGNPEETSAE